MNYKNIFHVTKSGLALAPQSVASATVNGATIQAPWSYGNQIRFLLLGGAFAAGSSGRVKVQGQRIDDDSWEALKEYDGTTDLEFTVTALDDAGALENGYLSGTLDLARVDVETYQAIRLTATAENANAQLFAAAYEIFELYETPSGGTDDLWTKHHG